MTEMTRVMKLNLKEVEEAWAETMEAKSDHDFQMADVLVWVSCQSEGIWTEKMKVYVGFLLAANFPPTSGIIEAGSIPE